MQRQLGNMFLTLTLVLCTLSLIGQNINIKISDTYFIKNATIVQKPGQMIEMGTMIIKDGVIQNVGKDLQPPADAIIIDADSMFVYPGFIDAFNTNGVKKEEENNQRGRGGRGGGNNNQVPDPDNPPDELAGILPERSLSDVFEKGEKSISSWREAGFTASLSAPEGGMLPGQASILLHSEAAADAAIIKDNIAMVGTFENAQRMYPATVIGVMSKYKSMMRQAGYALKHENAYNTNPVGMSRPAYDEGIRALYPVVEKKMPLIMEAEKIKDISRAFALESELDFTMYLANVKQGDFFLDEIKKAGIPVILSLDVPQSEDKKDAKSKDGKKGDKMKEDKDKEEKEDKKEEEEKDPEKEALKAKKEEAIKSYQSQAAMFQKGGVSITFSGKDAKTKDVKKNLKSMMDQGLSEEDALAALTVNAAELLGVSNIMGTLENGKMANLFISTGPYFEEDSNIKYVFVEGQQFEYEAKPKKKKTEGEAGADISGRYSYTVSVPGDARKGYLNIKKNGSSYDLTVDMGGDAMAVQDPEINGNAISFDFQIQEGGGMKVKFDVEIKGEQLEGSVTAGSYGSFPVEGERVGDPNLN